VPVKFEDGDWYRTCQECGNKQRAKRPDLNHELTNSYANSKCRKCKSEALDYGKTYMEFVPDDEE
jgi:hypothetical protein